MKSRLLAGIVLALAAVLCFPSLRGAAAAKPGAAKKDAAKAEKSDKADADKPKKKPTLIRDDTPVTQGSRPGLVTTYADIIEPAQKAVVSVYSTKIVKEQVNPLLRQMFGDRIPSERESKEEGLGSGVIVSPDGYILTNNHVVEGADELNVLLPDEREFKAKVIGADPKTDVAVIKIEADDLPTVVLADSDKIRVGDIVFAVGNPLGVGQTVTMGIVSAKGRHVGILEDVAGYEDFIQTDAAINQGNSGGALIDAKGRLVGVNSAIISTSRGNIGIGFAVPINLGATIMNSLIETGTVSRGFLGVSVDPVTADLAEALGLKKDTKGVIVTRVDDDTPASKAGLKAEDVMLSIDDKAIVSRDELRLLISQKLPGTVAQVKYLRGGKEGTLAVTLGRLPDDSAASNDLLPGIQASRLTDELRKKYRIDDAIGGLVVTDVDVKSAYSDRLQEGMVILQIDRSDVTDVQSAREALRPGRHLLRVFRRGGVTFIPITVDSR
jgi:serine protease Do/serine protease DegQ